ncbi:MAG: hypothetical protein IJ730_02180, partial [Alphaproteobacteria bacterium]|nr:hypothetical protein [Alphaproteobacteria bacterium]
MDLIDGSLNIVSLSLVFSLISFSVYLTTSILKVTDVSCDSCVTLGGCTYGALVIAGIHPIIAFFAAITCGIVAGFTISSITNHIGVELVVSSVVTMSIIQTFVLKLHTFGISIRQALQQKGISDIFGNSPSQDLVVIGLLVGIIAFFYYK